ncbi:alpha/beta fold hydrolase [Rhodococcus zopfii]|uniref:alpha/beta fold hydrolase n=1 Tax=Rhodococcus zopfii TaxID=43772 RepID=UPI0009337BB0|nr:alpha/beta hydrolase [Rhodococcus zopfii]
MTITHTVPVSGGRLHCEIRGAGPLLILTGAPMGAAALTSLAAALAHDHTVVTHDPRGIGRSILDDPHTDSTPDLRAADLVAVLDTLGTESADVFGTSGGAVTGLAVATLYPDRVRTLVAHEPPLPELLPDAAERRAAVDAMIDTFRRDGLAAAWAAFMDFAGFEDAGDAGPDAQPAGPPPGESPEQDLADGARFFAHEIRGTTRYLPDLAALAAAPARLVVGIGAESRGLETYATSVALAEALALAPKEFPGGHAGFMEQPEKFAAVLRETLTCP